MLAILVFRIQGGLEKSLERLKKEYEIDMILSRHKEEHLKAYQELLGQGKVPETKPLATNEWIQMVQAAVGEERLMLEELKPISESGRRGSGQGVLFLAVEGRMSELVNFFYRIAKANDLVYVKELLILPSGEESDFVRAELRLAQV
jgi:hypothetical protein